MGVSEHTIELAGSPAFFRTAPARDPQPLYLHGVPTSADDWTEMLERSGGIAVDLPGFGRTGKGGHLDLRPAGQAAFLLALLDHLEVGRVTAVAHDWGAAAALHLAASAPGRISRLVLVNPVGPGTDPRRLARLLRVPVVGELAIGSLSRRWLTRGLRGASTEAAWPPERLEAVWEQFDQGTQRALLRLARERTSPPAPPAGLPVALVHGPDDPWSAPEPWSDLLPQATRHEPAGTRHWPWLERPDAADLIVSLAAP